MASVGDKARATTHRDVAAYRRLLRAGASGTHPYVVLLGLRPADTPGLVRELEEGLDFSAFTRFRENIDLSMRELAEAVQISLRTLARRREQGRLQPDESDRLVRLSRVFARALDLFEGDENAARAWLLRAQVGLGGARPLDLARTDVGTREVEALIGRLEHGIFS